MGFPYTPSENERILTGFKHAFSVLHGQWSVDKLNDLFDTGHYIYSDNIWSSPPEVKSYFYDPFGALDPYVGRVATWTPADTADATDILYYGEDAAKMYSGSFVYTNYPSNEQQNIEKVIMPLTKVNDLTNQIWVAYKDPWGNIANGGSGVSAADVGSKTELRVRDWLYPSKYGGAVEPQIKDSNASFTGPGSKVLSSDPNDSYGGYGFDAFFGGVIVYASQSNGDADGNPTNPLKDLFNADFNEPLWITGYRYIGEKGGGGAGVGFPFSGSAVITGSMLVSGSDYDNVDFSLSPEGVSGSFSGSFEGLIDSSSYAVSSSYSLYAVSASHEIIKEVSSSHADSAISSSYADYAVSSSHTEFADSSNLASTASYVSSTSVDGILSQWTGSSEGIHRDGNVQITGSLNITGSSTTTGDFKVILDSGSGDTMVFQSSSGEDMVEIIPGGEGDLEAAGIVYAKNFYSTTTEGYLTNATSSKWASGSGDFVYREGKVSIGTSVSNSAALTVEGDISASGNIYLGGEVSASYALSALSASYALNAQGQGFVIPGGDDITNNYATIDFFNASGSGAITGSLIISGTGGDLWDNTLTVSGTTHFTDNITIPTGSLLMGTASFAETASFALNAGNADGGSGEGFPFSGSALITGSLFISGSSGDEPLLNVSGVIYSNDVGVLSGSILSDTQVLSSSILSDTQVLSSSILSDTQVLSSSILSDTQVLSSSILSDLQVLSGSVFDGLTITGSFNGNLEGTASWAESASYEFFKEVSSSHADNADSASHAENATSSSYSLYAVSASHEIIKEVSSSHADSTISSSHAEYADLAGSLVGGITLDGSFSGSASGSFEGDGSGLTDIQNVQTASYVSADGVDGVLSQWTASIGPDIWYTQQFTTDYSTTMSLDAANFSTQSDFDPNGSGYHPQVGFERLLDGIPKNGGELDYPSNFGSFLRTHWFGAHTSSIDGGHAVELIYDFGDGNDKCIGAIRYFGYSSTSPGGNYSKNYSPQDITVYGSGSDSGTEWQQIHHKKWELDDHTGLALFTASFDADETGSYQMYRFRFSGSMYGLEDCYFQELQVFERSLIPGGKGIHRQSDVQITGSLALLSGSLDVSGSIDVLNGITGSFKGSGQDITGVISASYAETSSYSDNFTSLTSSLDMVDIKGQLTITGSSPSVEAPYMNITDGIGLGKIIADLSQTNVAVIVDETVQGITSGQIGPSGITSQKVLIASGTFLDNEPDIVDQEELVKISGESTSVPIDNNTRLKFHWPFDNEHKFDAKVYPSKHNNGYNIQIEDFRFVSHSQKGMAFQDGNTLADVSESLYTGNSTIIGSTGDWSGSGYLNLESDPNYDTTIMIQPANKISHMSVIGQYGRIKNNQEIPTNNVKYNQILPIWYWSGENTVPHEYRYDDFSLMVNISSSLNHMGTDWDNESGHVILDIDEGNWDGTEFNNNWPNSSGIGKFTIQVVDDGKIGVMMTECQGQGYPIVYAWTGSWDGGWNNLGITYKSPKKFGSAGFNDVGQLKIYKNGIEDTNVKSMILEDQWNSWKNILDAYYPWQISDGKLYNFLNTLYVRGYKTSADTHLKRNTNTYYDFDALGMGRWSRWNTRYMTSLSSQNDDLYNSYQTLHNHASGSTYYPKYKGMTIGAGNLSAHQSPLYNPSPADKLKINDLRIYDIELTATEITQVSSSGQISIVQSGGNDLLRVKGPVYLGNSELDSHRISGSLLVTNGITGSLEGTASYAEYAVSASHEITYEQSSSYSDSAVTASYAETSSFSDGLKTHPKIYGDVYLSGSLMVTGSDITAGQGSKYRGDVRSTNVNQVIQDQVNVTLQGQVSPFGLASDKILVVSGATTNDLQGTDDKVKISRTVNVTNDNELRYHWAFDGKTHLTASTHPSKNYSGKQEVDATMYAFVSRSEAGWSADASNDDDFDDCVEFRYGTGDWSGSGYLNIQDKRTITQNSSDGSGQGTLYIKGDLGKSFNALSDFNGVMSPTTPESADANLMVHSSLNNEYNQLLPIYYWDIESDEEDGNEYRYDDFTFMVTFSSSMQSNVMTNGTASSNVESYHQQALFTMDGGVAWDSTEAGINVYQRYVNLYGQGEFTIQVVDENKLGVMLTERAYNHPMVYAWTGSWDGEWHNLAVTFESSNASGAGKKLDAGTLSVYKDGVKVESGYKTLGNDELEYQEWMDYQTDRKIPIIQKLIKSRTYNQGIGTDHPTYNKLDMGLWNAYTHFWDQGDLGPNEQTGSSGMTIGGGMTDSNDGHFAFGGALNLSVSDMRIYTTNLNQDEIQLISSSGAIGSYERVEGKYLNVEGSTNIGYIGTDKHTVTGSFDVKGDILKDGVAIGSGGGSGAGFPFSGSAVITGSMLVSGSGNAPKTLTVDGDVSASGNFYSNGTKLLLSSETSSLGGSSIWDGTTPNKKTANNLEVTGSVTISGSNTLTNYGDFNNNGSVTISGDNEFLLLNQGRIDIRTRGGLNRISDMGQIPRGRELFLLSTSYNYIPPVSMFKIAQGPHTLLDVQTTRWPWNQYQELYSDNGTGPAVLNIWTRTLPTGSDATSSISGVVGSGLEIWGRIESGSGGITSESLFKFDEGQLIDGKINPLLGIGTRRPKASLHISGSQSGSFDTLLKVQNEDQQNVFTVTTSSLSIGNTEGSSTNVSMELSVDKSGNLDFTKNESGTKTKLLTIDKTGRIASTRNTYTNNWTSGSTEFGLTGSVDRHQFTGSMFVSNELKVGGYITGSLYSPEFSKPIHSRKLNISFNGFGTSSNGQSYLEDGWGSNAVPLTVRHSNHVVPTLALSNEGSNKAVIVSYSTSSKYTGYQKGDYLTGYVYVGDGPGVFRYKGQSVSISNSNPLQQAHFQIGERIGVNTETPEAHFHLRGQDVSKPGHTDTLFLIETGSEELFYISSSGKVVGDKATFNSYGNITGSHLNVTGDITTLSNINAGNHPSDTHTFKGAISASMGGINVSDEITGHSLKADAPINLSGSAALTIAGMSTTSSIYWTHPSPSAPPGLEYWYKKFGNPETDDNITLQTLTTYNGAATSFQYNMDIIMKSGSKFAFGGDSANNYIITNGDTPEDLEIHADQDILLTPDNNVGIGTTTPIEKLTVLGNISASGDIRIGGNIYANEFHTTYNSSSIVYSSGSTQFGDDSGDTHTFTGDLNTGNVLPHSSKIYSLGSTAKRWGKLYMASEIDVSGSALGINNGVNITGSLTVSGSNTLTNYGTFTNYGNGTVSGDLKAAEFVDIKKSTKKVEVSGSLRVSGSNTLIVEGPTELSGSLNVLNDITTDEDISSRQLTATSHFNVGGNIIPTGKNQSIGGQKKDQRFSKLYLASQIDVSGSVLTISSPSASIAGDEFAVNVTGSLTVSGSNTFKVQGPTEFTGSFSQTNGNIDTSGDISGKDLSVSGDASAKNITATSNMSLGGNLIPTGKNQTIGTAKKDQRFTRVYLASHIDVSGSELIISSPSASAAGDSFDILVSGSLKPMDSGSTVTLGSLDAPFKDLYVQSSSINLVDPSDKSVATISKTDVDTLKTGQSLAASGAVTASEISMGNLTLSASGGQFEVTYDDGGTNTELSISELDKLSGLTATTTEMNKLAGFTGTKDDLNLAKDLRSGGATKVKWQNIEAGRFDLVAPSKEWIIGSSLLPNIPAGKGQGLSIGNEKFRWSKLYLASHIDVSGSELIISSPSASAVGDTFEIKVSGSILPSDYDEDAPISLGSSAAPFKDLYVTSASIYFSDIAKAKEEKGADWKDMEESDREAYTTRFGKDELDRLYAGQTLVTDDNGDYTNAITASAIQYKGTDLTVGATALNYVGSLNSDLSGKLNSLGDDILARVKISETGSMKVAEANKAATAATLENLTAQVGELNILDGVTATSTELNKLDGFTGRASDLNYAKDLYDTGVTATEFNTLDGVGSTALSVQLAAKLATTGGTITGPLANRINTIKGDTVNVNGGNLFITGNEEKAVKVGALGKGTEGQEITIIAKDTVTTLAHGGGQKSDDLCLYLGTDYTMKLNDTIVLVYDGKFWYEKSRSQNSANKK